MSFRFPTTKDLLFSDMRNSFLHLVLRWSESATSKDFNSFPWLDLEGSTTSAVLKKSNWTQQTQINETILRGTILIYRPICFYDLIVSTNQWSLGIGPPILHVAWPFCISYNYSVSMNFRTWKPPSSAQIKKLNTHDILSLPFCVFFHPWHHALHWRCKLLVL